MKRIKDPIYGYIDVPDRLITEVIDTPEFQRLRDIIQTSYSVLYPSTLHNRFVHSLGVYYLGCEAMKVLLRDSDIETKKLLMKYKSSFELACLLHDVGHAPFSHTGEYFYLKGDNRSAFHDKLCQLLRDKSLRKEIDAQGYKAAPHELMSTFVGLEVFGNSIPRGYKRFFARCITGYKYSNTDNQPDLQIQNCLIELLNSKVFDVDKIDYLIRDSYASGFDASAIDYVRLLSQLRIERVEESGKYEVVFTKNGLSVIENVVFAHDLERRWIQNHPAVLYDSYLLKRVLEDIQEKYFKDNDCLPYQMFTQKGISRRDTNDMIRLASDSDIVYLMKNLTGNEFVEEYFDRRRRKHPLWKSEEQFRAIFSDIDKESGCLEVLEEAFRGLETHQKRDGIQINRETLVELEDDISSAKKGELKDIVPLSEIDDSASIEQKEAQLKIMNIFKEFAVQNEIEFDFLVLYTDEFSSGFKKPEFGDIIFNLSPIKGYYKFKDISDLPAKIEQESESKKKYFFIYCKKNEQGKMPGFSELLTKLIIYAEDVSAKRNTEKIRGRVR